MPTTLLSTSTSLEFVCAAPDHLPDAEFLECASPGTYEHKCSGCRQKIQFVVRDEEDPWVPEGC